MTRRSAKPGFSLVEAAIASVIVGGVLVVSLNVIGASAAASQRISDRDRADLLARDLMSEILTKPYADPEFGPMPMLGPDLGEATGSRILFDDADDYHGWNGSPIQGADGTPVPGFSAWSRTVACRRLLPNPLDAISPESRILEIEVTVRRSGTTLATLVGVRTNSWKSP
jgi:MSHA pilin protein MshD